MKYLVNSTNIIVAISALLACISELFPQLNLSYWLPPPNPNVSETEQVKHYFSSVASIARFLVSITIWLPLRARIFILSGANMVLHLAIRYALALSFMSRFSKSNQKQLKWLILGYVAAFLMICYVLWSPLPLLVILGGMLISWSGRSVSESEDAFTNVAGGNNMVGVRSVNNIEKYSSTQSEYIPMLDYAGRLILCAGFLYTTHRLLITKKHKN